MRCGDRTGTAGADAARRSARAVAVAPDAERDAMWAVSDRRDAGAVAYGLAGTLACATRVTLTLGRRER